MPISKLWQAALALSAFTVFYNLAEGVISVVFGYSDETLTLFGFGLDSFVEVISGVGVLHMVIRVRGNHRDRDSFERTALRITGAAFYLLALGLTLTAGYHVYWETVPVTTLWGVGVSTVSILAMTFLVRMKMRVGRALNSHSLIADANCTKTCIYFSVVLLVSSLCFEVFQVSYIDSAGALGIAYYSFREGREAFAKAGGENGCGCEEPPPPRGSG